MRLGLTLGMVALTALAGCSANVGASSEGEPDSVTPQTTAIVTFERAENGDSVRSITVARFVQAAHVDDGALRLVGATLDLPPSDGCRMQVGDSDFDSSRAVELADVGMLSVSSPGANTGFSLVPRQVPDPVGLVSGVLYYAPVAPITPAASNTSNAEAAQIQPGAKYVVRGAGKDDVAAFEMTANAPLDVGEIRVGDQAFANLALAQSSQVDLAWSIADESRDENGETSAGDEDVFFVDVTTARGSARCAASSRGATLLPSAFSGDEGTIAVHRIHREFSQFAQARGLASAELRFDFSRTTTFSRY